MIKRMIYKANFKISKDKFVEKVFEESTKSLGKFYDINWTADLPKVFILKDRKTINLFGTKKTEPWLVAWADYGMQTVFILDRKGFEKYSSNKYSDEYYSSLIKHELSHLFYKTISGGKWGPKWLSEGVAIYTSGQTKLKPKPKEFKNFLSFYEHSGPGVYAESGFVIEALVKKFGKDKLLELIRSLQNISTEIQFNKIFKKVYKFSIGYKLMNDLIK